MLIGIDASRAFGASRTGTENYSYHLISHLLRLPEAEKYTFVLFTRTNAIIPGEFHQKNVIIQPINFRYLWTQVGLAWATWGKYGTPILDRGLPSIQDRSINLDVLWIPAHTLPVLRNPRVKTVVTIHGLEYRWLPEYRNRLQRWYLPLSTFYAARHADRLIAVSKFTAEELIKETQISLKKIKVIHEGVISDTSEYSENQMNQIYQKFGVEHKKYILFVGTVQPRKNLVALIQAFSQAELPQDWRLVIAGGVGWQAAEVLQAPRLSGVQERVVFTGRVSEGELSALHQGAAIYTQPSHTEGFGLPVLEAMVAGVPVVVSDGGALPEVVGRAGMVVPLGRSFVPKLAAAITRLAREQKLRTRLISLGRVRAALLTWDKTARETLKVLETTVY